MERERHDAGRDPADERGLLRTAGVSSPTGGCPLPEELAAFIAGDHTDSETGTRMTVHVAQCATCRQRAAGLQADRVLVDEWRALLLDPPETVEQRSRQSSDRASERIGDFVLLREIGSGGQGSVWRARDTRTGREAAIKFLHLGPHASSRQRLRLAREIEIVSRLRHPGIVTLFEVITLPTGGKAFVMECVDGVALDRWARRERERQSPASFAQTAVMLLAAVCDAMHHAHLHGVVHRDLKPGNILVDDAGQPHIVDFGIAKQSRAFEAGDGGVTATSATVSAEILGSPPYMAPEQAQLDGDVDLRADIFALGAIAYEVLTGQRAFPERDRIERLPSLMDDERSPPSAGRSVAFLRTRDLDAVLAKALARRPGDRYQSAGEFALDLRSLAEGQAVLARRGSFAFAVRSLARRHRRRLALASVGGLLVLAVGVTFLLVRWQAMRREDVLITKGTVLASMLTDWNLVMPFGLGGREPQGRFTVGTLTAMARQMDDAFASGVLPSDEMDRLRHAFIRASLVSEEAFETAERFASDIEREASEAGERISKRFWRAVVALKTVQSLRGDHDAIDQLAAIGAELLTHAEASQELQEDIRLCTARLPQLRLQNEDAALGRRLRTEAASMSDPERRAALERRFEIRRELDRMSRAEDHESSLDQP